MWSALNPDDLDILSWSLTDFKRISDFTPAAYTQLHQQDLAWLKENIQRIRQHEPQRRVIVLTHHSPTIDGTGDSKFLGGPTNSAFATELSEDMEVWGNPVLFNQRGYKEGGPGYDPTKVVTI
ncbi:hypothetical protein MPER_03764 [Moniliophthora perniciosa FA553]|nr:hypothetical protein MPER_03764 [Moniliophthora perniciosa FA553]